MLWRQCAGRTLSPCGKYAPGREQRRPPWPQFLAGWARAGAPTSLSTCSCRRPCRPEGPEVWMELAQLNILSDSFMDFGAVQSPFSSYTVKKGQRFSCPEAGCQLPNSPWPGIIYFFPAREILVSDIPIPAGDGKTTNLFYSIYPSPICWGGGECNFVFPFAYISNGYPLALSQDVVLFFVLKAQSMPNLNKSKPHRNLQQIYFIAYVEQNNSQPPHFISQ